MKKKPKKLTIAATFARATIGSWAAASLTRDQLVVELKARNIPVPKTKSEMTIRLRDYLAANSIPVTVTIG